MCKIMAAFKTVTYRSLVCVVCSLFVTKLALGGHANSGHPVFCRLAGNNALLPGLCVLSLIIWARELIYYSISLEVSVSE